MSSSTKGSPLKIVLFVTALYLAVHTLGVFCLAGFPIADSKENTEKIIRLLNNGKTELMHRGMLYTGYDNDNPYISSRLPTPFSLYYIQDVGTVLWWSDADSVIDAKYEELEAKNKIKW